MLDVRNAKLRPSAIYDQETVDPMRADIRSSISVWAARGTPAAHCSHDNISENVPETAVRLDMQIAMPAVNAQRELTKGIRDSSRSRERDRKRGLADSARYQRQPEHWREHEMASGGATSLTCHLA